MGKGSWFGRNDLNHRFELMVSAIEKHTKEINQYLQEQAIVFQQIASTISDSLYLKIKGRTTIKEAWDMLTSRKDPI
jgi:hypothetical protein